MPAWCSQVSVVLVAAVVGVQDSACPTLGRLMSALPSAEAVPSTASLAGSWSCAWKWAEEEEEH